MKVCILAKKFPTVSETFVTDHVRAVHESGAETTVIADDQSPEAWASLGEFGAAIRPHVHYYRRPPSSVPGYRGERLSKLATLAQKHYRQRSFQFFHSLNLFRFGSTVTDFKLPFLVDQAIEVGPVDVLHCHFGSNGILGAQLKQLGFCKKLVVTFHGLDVSKTILKKNNGSSYRTLFEQADAILPISNLWRRVLVDAGAPEDKTRVHHLGVHVGDQGRQLSTAGDQSIRIATTARFTEKKGLPYALKVIKELVEARPNVKLQYDLIGSGELWSVIQQQVADLGLENIVTLHGALAHQEVKALLQEADIFLLPSHTASNGDQEGIPVSLMEAMATSVAVVSTKHSGIPELIEDGKNGLLAEERNVAGLTDALTKLVDNPALRHRFASEARQTVQERFNADSQNKSLLTLYRDLLSS